MGIYERKMEVVNGVDVSTGELVSHIERRVYLVKGSGRYVTQYDYRFLYDFSGVASGVLFWMAFEAKYGTNLVVLDEKYLVSKLDDLRLGNVRRFRKLVRDFERNNLVFSVGRWSWVVNPMIFFKGSQKVRAELIKKLIQDGRVLQYRFSSKGDSEVS